MTMWRLQQFSQRLSDCRPYDGCSACSVALRPVLVAILAVVLMGLGLGAALAHGEPLQADVTLTPASPRLGEEAKLLVRLYGASTGSPLTGAEVKLVGEMSGHAMTAVEALLAPTAEAGEYAGPVTFSMAGPWAVKLLVSHAGEHARLALAVAVREQGAEVDTAALSQSLTFQLESAPPSYPLIVVIAAVALIVGLMALAVGRRRLAVSAGEADQGDV